MPALRVYVQSQAGNHGQLSLDCWGHPSFVAVEAHQTLFQRNRQDWKKGVDITEEKLKEVQMLSAHRQVHGQLRAGWVTQIRRSMKLQVGNRTL